MNILKKLTATLAISASLIAGAYAQTQGVTDREVKIGSSTDLSGIFAAFGAPSAKAAQLYFDEVNANGGVHGRQIKFIVEDHGYQLPKATQAINKLVNRDKVFATFLQVGTPMNIAGFKLTDAKNIPNIFPLTMARQILQDPFNLHFSPGASYYEQIKQGVTYLNNEKGVANVCAMYIPSDFGKEIQEGANDVAAELGLTFAAETTHKPDDADFVGALSKLKEADCGIVAMALGVRQTITAYATAQKIGFTEARFISSAAGFHSVMAKVPGGVTEGLYAAAVWSDILPRVKTNATLGAWFMSYTKATGEQLPGTGAVLGRAGAESLVRALEAAGKDLTVESFIAGMESLSYYDDILDAQVDFSKEDHAGVDEVIISVIKDANWQVVSRD
ncbi:MAG: ABC transporter substrate-binding protein [Devosiaceae bacterium]|nr:ABC transporter substrate-binding protein [Devosiaceae bacterium]